jgi:hypothetical protein
MAGENRTPDKIIGEIKYAEDQTERTKEQQREKEDVRSNPKRDPSEKEDRRILTRRAPYRRMAAQRQPEDSGACSWMSIIPLRSVTRLLGY